jgi:hypothetical protein
VEFAHSVLEALIAQAAVMNRLKVALDKGSRAVKLN